MRRPATRLREAFLPGDPVNIDDACRVVGGDRVGVSRAMYHLAHSGYFDPVRQRLWVRSGAPVDPYRLSGRITQPYALAYGSALALHGASGSERTEILITSPGRFDPFEYEGVFYRRASPWNKDGLARVPVGPEFITTTSRERTLVDCIRVPANAGGLTEVIRGVLALGTLDTDEIVHWVDHHREATLAARVGLILEHNHATDPVLLRHLEQRRPHNRFYLQPGQRGGHVNPRWNAIVASHLIPAPVVST